MKSRGLLLRIQVNTVPHPDLESVAGDFVHHGERGNRQEQQGALD